MKFINSNEQVIEFDPFNQESIEPDTKKPRKFYPMQVARRLHNKAFPDGADGRAISSYFMRKGVMALVFPTSAEWSHIMRDPSLPAVTVRFLHD
jgi:hypothetical protein